MWGTRHSWRGRGHPGLILTHNLFKRYSDLACAGSSRDARHAGPTQASMATDNSATTTQPNTAGSSGVVS